MNSLELNLNIYPLKYIEKAIEDYMSIVKITYSIEADKILLSFNCNEDDFRLISNEFGNYLIGLIGKYV
ncbi:hypothetical protein I6U48_25050 [Clostridium sp. PL3]|uniref:Uncharacterized protein n=1 Tax=Clostridium thailandense TaxID=2794346 RepID=A0A949WXN5_9CLOT|nr:HxsD-like protein [Clostridium thailandense]MBV7276157.1 hypothetical protein [Clostridium thailandense]